MREYQRPNKTEAKLEFEKYMVGEGQIKESFMGRAWLDELESHKPKITVVKNLCTTLVDVCFVYSFSFFYSVVTLYMVLFSFSVVFCLDVADLWLRSCRDSLGFCLQVSGVCV